VSFAPVPASHFWSFIMGLTYQAQMTTKQMNGKILRNAQIQVLPKRRWSLLVSGYPTGGRPLLEQV